MKEVMPQPVSRLRVLWELLSQPIVSLPPALTTLCALGGGATELLTPWQAGALFGMGILYFIGMSSSLVVDKEAVQNVVKKLDREQDEIDAELDLNRMFEILNSSDYDTAECLKSILKLHQAFEEEINSADKVLKAILSDVCQHAETLRTNAFTMAKLKQHALKIINRTDVSTLEKEVRKLKKAIGKQKDHPLKSALESTKGEIKAFERLKKHDQLLYAQINNIRGAMRQAQFDVVKLKMDAAIGEGRSAGMKESTAQLMQKLKVVEETSKQVMSLDS